MAKYVFGVDIGATTVKVFKACLAAVRKQKYQLIRGTECQTRRRSGTGTCQGN